MAAWEARRPHHSRFEQAAQSSVVAEASSKRFEAASRQGGNRQVCVRSRLEERALQIGFFGRFLHTFSTKSLPPGSSLAAAPKKRSATSSARATSGPCCCVGGH